MSNHASIYRFIFVVPRPNGIDFSCIVENYETIEQANRHFEKVQEKFEAKGGSPRFYIMEGSNVLRQSKGQDQFRLEDHLRRGGTIVGDWHGQLCG